MATLTVHLNGSCSVEQHDLEELGINVSDQIKVQLEPEGRASWSTINKSESGTLKWQEVAGFLQGKTTVKLTIDEMNEAIAKGWAGQVTFDDHE